MSTIFTKIAKGEIPSYKVAENEDYYAFLDIAPLASGHTLVIPKNVEDDYIFNLDDAVYLGLCAFAKKVAEAIGRPSRAKGWESLSSGWRCRIRIFILYLLIARLIWISEKRNLSLLRRNSRQ